MTVFDAVFTLSSPVVKDYRNDLVVHDHDAIEANPGVPFVHWSRASGTHITFLSAADTYPAAGVYVRYVFGDADREHVLREKDAIAKHFLNPCYDSAELVLHYDGKRVWKITATEALEIVKQYQRRIANEWNKPAGRVGCTELSAPHCYC